MKCLFLFLSLFYTFIAAAQDRFIEITVDDTVMIKSDYFIYRLYLVPGSDTPDWADTLPATDQIVMDKKTYLNNAFDSLVNVLRREGFTVLPRLLSDSFTVFDKSNEFRYARLFTRSTDTLAMISKRARTFRFLTGSFEVAKAADETSGYSRLYKKLLNIASARAALIASGEKQKLGRLLNIREASAVQNPDGDWTAFPPLSALGSSFIPGWHTTTLGSPYANMKPDEFNLYPLRKTFVVRYALE